MSGIHSSVEIRSLDEQPNDSYYRSLQLFNNTPDDRSGVAGELSEVEELSNDTNLPHIEWKSELSINYTFSVMVIVASLLFIVIIATAFGNLLVGVALFRYRYLQTVSNYLIGNLALSDFLLAVTILPLSTFNECLGYWIFGRVLCNIWLIMDVLYCTASIWNLCIIAFDRFTATLYPVWYREKRSARQAAIYAALVWVIAAVICVPPLLGWNDLAQNYIQDSAANVSYCVLFQTTSYVIYSACGSFYIPFVITFFLYVRIFVVLRRRMIKLRGPNTAHAAGGSTQSTSTFSSSFASRRRRLIGSAKSDRSLLENLLKPSAATIAEMELTSMAVSSAVDVEEEWRQPRTIPPSLRGTDCRVSRSSSSVGCNDRRGDDELLKQPQLPQQQRMLISLKASSCAVESATITTAVNNFQAANDKKVEEWEGGRWSRLLSEGDEIKIELKHPSPNELINGRIDTTQQHEQLQRQEHHHQHQQQPPQPQQQQQQELLQVNQQIVEPQSQKQTLSKEENCDVISSDNCEEVTERPNIAAIVIIEDLVDAVDDVDATERIGRVSIDSRSQQPAKHLLQVSSCLEPKKATFGRALDAVVQKLGEASKRGSGGGLGDSLIKKCKATRVMSQRQRYEQREMRATIRMAIIIAFFCGMWLGFFTVYTIRGCCPDCFISRELDAFFFWLGYSNSSVNPILYTIFNEEFRRAFQKIMGCYTKKLGNQMSSRRL